MTAFLPPNLLALFAPRDPIPYASPLDQLVWEKKPWNYSGVSQYLHLFEDPNETPEPTRAETKSERRERKRQEAKERGRVIIEKRKGEWDPHTNPDATGDPFKTLFVSRINFDTSESKLRREFEQYGPIRKIRMIYETGTGKPRGYSFIEYEHERDMHAAYKYADGKKIDGKRVLVDVERGRTVKGWIPRKIGGGMGATRRGAPSENVKISGRDDHRERERDRGDRDRGDRDRGDRDRDRGERDHHRGGRRDSYRRSGRDEIRESRRRSRSRDRDRRERKRRSRSRDRRRRRSRSHDRKRHRHDRDNGHSRREERDESPGRRDSPPRIKREKIEMEEGEVPPD
ncbi:U1 small nuclear ribonucleoprotein 70 kDa-like [Oscarella lobularis]|uniref:U1 small nuclear ribonucleoprotein 70 kDa-like n=1 Tax=Oscarella lobularis TaxID=121494 RepID=UPI0033135756